MVSNNIFRLSDEQLAAYTEWAQRQGAAHAEADALESLEISVTFTFTPYGREVVASVGESNKRLVIESLN